MGSYQPCHTVLFDLDGTLIDHFRCIYRCYCYALKHLDMDPVPYEQVRATVGGSVLITMERLIGKTHAEEATRLFREHFAEIMLEDLHPLPGAAWLLETLHLKGYQTAVFTNKQGPGSRKILEHLGYTRWLDGIFGTLDTPWRKPQPEFTAHVLDELEANPEHTMLIGDSPFDIEAARTHQLSAHVVATGSHTSTQLRANNPAPDGVWDNLWQLGEQVFRLSLPDAVTPAHHTPA